jgi:hypothetical protein
VCCVVVFKAYKYILKQKNSKQQIEFESFVYIFKTKFLFFNHENQFNK